MDDHTPGYDEPDRDELLRPLTVAEWDYLIANEQNATAEPYEGRA